MSGPGQRKRHVDLEPKTCKTLRWPGLVVNLYAPWWAPSRRKRELGFMVRVRDPRGCTHEHLEWRAPGGWGGSSEWVPFCRGCKRQLHRPLRRRKGPRWRWIKVFVATTKARGNHAHGIFVAEAETHLTDNEHSRLTTKGFVRLKCGIGGRYV
jgi:hypothetical protein